MKKNQKGFNFQHRGFPKAIEKWTISTPAERSTVKKTLEEGNKKVETLFVLMEINRFGGQFKAVSKNGRLNFVSRFQPDLLNVNQMVNIFR